MEVVKHRINNNDQLLTDSAPRSKYRRRADEDKIAIPWGQRKLFLSEIQFLSTYANLAHGAIVIYVGAAPGNHILFLAELFPKISWHLYDPAKFKIGGTPKIKIYQQLFTDETAKSWEKTIPTLEHKVFLISDIRSGDPKLGSEKFEKAVAQDMKLQMNWHLMLNPKQSLLKFRLPYPTDTLKVSKYLAGTVYKQCWAPQTSSETRLVPSRDNKGNWIIKDWDLIRYEEQLFHFNTKIREETKFDQWNPDGHNLEDPEVEDLQLSSDFDSANEILIWNNFLLKLNLKPTKKNIVAMANLLTARINKGKNKADWDTLAKLRVNPWTIKQRNSSRKNTRNG